MRWSNEAQVYHGNINVKHLSRCACYSLTSVTLKIPVYTRVPLYKTCPTPTSMHAWSSAAKHRNFSVNDWNLHL